MNNDLFSAHFLVRKMQEDPIGKWLHGILHKLEGDYANAKCWVRPASSPFSAAHSRQYRDMPADVLASYFDASDAQRDAWLYLDRIAILSGKTQDWCRKTSETAEIQDRAADPPTLESLNEDEVRKQAWGELVCVLEMLEREHGWARDVDGSKAYTSDGKEIGDAKVSMLLGEGGRVF